MRRSFVYRREGAMMLFPNGLVRIQNVPATQAGRHNTIITTFPGRRRILCIQPTAHTDIPILSMRGEKQTVAQSRVLAVHSKAADLRINTTQQMHVQLLRRGAPKRVLLVSPPQRLVGGSLPASGDWKSDLTSDKHCLSSEIHQLDNCMRSCWDFHVRCWVQLLCRW